MSISWDFSDTPLGVNNGQVFLEGYDFRRAEGEIPEILIGFNREDYLKGLNQWLDAKQEYCERYGHFCGQNGSSSTEDFTECPIDFSSKYTIAYYPKSWTEPDMEHG